jgi:two-component system sensor histidine kinase PhoQ
MNSLRTRMVFLASLVLITFLGFTALALNRAFTNTALELVHERLQAQTYALLAAADVQADGTFDVAGLRDPRFSLPDSGLYAIIRDQAGREIWRSASLLDHTLDLPEPTRSGEAEFGETATSWHDDVFYLGYRVHWEVNPGQERIFNLHIAQTRTGFDDQVARFRSDLWRWLAGLALGLLVMQALVLRIGLSPLPRLAQQLRAIESGQRELLSEDQPSELRALVINMNNLIRFGRTSLERHRNALADLAHALKTPLAVLRGATEDLSDDVPGGDAGLRNTLNDCVTRMDEAISYRMRRASAAGASSLATPVDVHTLAERICSALLKVYADKSLHLEVSGTARIQADEGDLSEILGNLLDNACKWANSSVQLLIDTEDNGGMRLVVEDDGPGIAMEQRSHILQRGVRADEQEPGQGLGLALVRELVVDHYGGYVSLDESARGGAKVTVFLDAPTD